MSKSKYYYLVCVMTNEGMKFVTDINYQTKFAEWKDGEEAKKFTMSIADDLVFGLSMNFTPAFTCKVPSYIENIKND